MTEQAQRKLNTWGERIILVVLSCALAFGVMQATVIQNSAAIEKLDEKKADKELVIQMNTQILKSIDDLRQDLRDWKLQNK